MRTPYKLRLCLVEYVAAVLFLGVGSAAGCSYGYNPDIVINGVSGYAFFEEKPLLGTKVSLWLSAADPRYKKDLAGPREPLKYVLTGEEGKFNFGKLKAGYYGVELTLPTDQERWTLR